ncbi:HDOD domain-containing protein [Reinekea sp.]|jgi:HD-like signal output (HDOD) protein|uniref:HDOD domain-containing protein n=1 Tax=Reinekea sp. TaxID=1970455 RepID=UPI002A80181A|nr:HDOD domain-containing protein [Reinekea sp.]
MSIDLDPDQIDKILQGISIPPQPQVMVDLQMEQYHPTPDIGRIAKLIAQDVGLSGTMLKIVNSAAFGLANNVTSVEQATVFLGIKSVVNIINGISIRGELSDEDILTLNNFWDTSMDIAVVSQNIARQIGMAAPDDAYALGLFHNAGIVLMHKRFPSYMAVLQAAHAQDSERVIDLENQHFNTNHAVIGYYTARSWRLPKLICDAIADHHNLKHLFERDALADAPKKTLLSVLKIAEHICGNGPVLGKVSEDYEWTRIKASVYEFTGLGPYDIDSMIDQFSEMGISSVITRS